MTTVNVEGKAYTLRFDMEAMEEAEELFGGMQEMQAALGGTKQVKAIRELFRIMANSGETYEGREKTTTGREIMRMTVSEMKDLSRQMIAEIGKSIGVKLKDPEEEKDGIIVDIEAEEGKNGTAGIS